MPTSSRRKVILFLVLTYALSSIFYVMIASSGQMAWHCWRRRGELRRRGSPKRQRWRLGCRNPGE